MMTYEGNGDGVAVSTENHNENYISLESSPFQSLGGDDGHEDSKSRESHDLEKDSSKISEKDRDKDREKDRDREKSSDRDREKSRDRDRERSKDRERDRHHRDRHRDRSRERSEKRERERDDFDDDDHHHRSRDRDRRRSRDRDREVRHRRRSRSRSRSRSERRSRSEHRHKSEHRSRSRSQSRSRSKSKRRSGFDMAPPDMLAATAVAAAGQVPSVPTTATIPGMFPNMFPMVPGQQLGALPVLPVQAMTQQATRHARRVYVGGLPPTANEQSVATFFSQVMSAIGGNTAGPGDAVVNVYINHEKKFAFVEMRSVEEASNAMALDGIILEGVPVKVRRPTDYNPSLAATLGPSQPNPNLNLAAVGLSSGSTGGLEGPDRIFVGGLPYYFTEVQIRELLESFGPLRGFNLVKDRETGNSKGYAFCVYQDPSVTDIACAALNGIKMGDKTLTVRRAIQGVIQPKPEQEEVLLHAQQQIALQRLMLQPGGTPTKIVCLTQVVTADDLRDDEEYADIMEDMRQEGGKFGNLVNVVIPRPNPDHDPTPGVGKVFLEYADVDGSSKARSGMNGRKFGGNQVVAVYYPEDKYLQGDYED
ncbi:RNA recognition motif domain [Arabidopsis thaliana x Arabidopsis arenosa]|uniref:Splicing factor U2af large subunit n=1 Tax=Arabidopsis thaliana x Arabidopsis arenosa TaxID=1240361 RepID=A0A8T2BF33_9BRAS|nr:RNA recognition motif domain [Arabidopsis thaliana x Arabidopsis arenosa]